MEFDVGFLIAGIDLIVGIIVVVLASSVARKTKGSALFWASALFLLTGIMYVTHAGVEVILGDEGLYAMTALVATILLGFTLVIIDITTRMLGVDK